jgi:multidrug transporter EmrE-like cation transporter
MSRLWPTIGFAASALISFGLLTLALRELEVGLNLSGVNP